jgi:hypothetical protein
MIYKFIVETKDNRRSVICENYDLSVPGDRDTYFSLVFSKEEKKVIVTISFYSPSFQKTYILEFNESNESNESEHLDVLYQEISYCMEEGDPVNDYSLKYLFECLQEMLFNDKRVFIESIHHFINPDDDSEVVRIDGFPEDIYLGQPCRFGPNRYFMIQLLLLNNI